MSDDRKYRQRGYQDDDRERAPKPAARKPQEPGAPAGARRISQDGPKNINMPGFREVVRCAQCGNPVSTEIGFDTRCPRCGTDLHACSQCVSFDPGSRFECMKLISARARRAPGPTSTVKRAPAILVPRSKSMIPSAGPRSQWACGANVNARGVPTRRTSLLSSALLPTGTDECGMFGMTSRPWFRRC